MSGGLECSIIGYDFLDRPIEECTDTLPTSIPCIVDNKSFSADAPSTIRLSNNQITVIVQDNE
ncbi:hypothetical protein [Metabacillus fastidiosus]|uniref:hypothetical protein n=1 Tax=Metabacillus fastidiosus TaxID=1458 RepID=UPI003D2CEA7F